MGGSWGESRAKGLGVAEREGKRRRWRWTALRRARVLAVLEETGNLTAAAEAAGTSYKALHRLRKRDPGYARLCEAAAKAAHERLDESGDAFGEGDGAHAIQRTSNGRYQLTAVRRGYWTKRDDETFFTHLRRTGNIDASARATGFDESTVWKRYYRWPAFAERWERVLDEASLALEFRLACEGNQIEAAPDGEGGGEAGLDSRLRGNDGAREHDGPPDAKFDPERALKFLKWREDKKTRGRRRGPAPRRPPIEEVANNIVRKVEAIKRHRRRRQHGGGEP
jgi:hypothetical protein